MQTADMKDKIATISTIEQTINVRMVILYYMICIGHLEIRWIVDRIGL